MNKLATQLDLNNSKMSEVVYQAQEGEGDEKGDEGCEVRIHPYFLEL